MKNYQIITFFILLSVLTIPVFSQSLQVTTTIPTQDAISVAKNSIISITFNQPIQSPIGHAFYVTSDTRGMIEGDTDVNGNTLTFQAIQDFAAGDQILVGLTAQLLSVDGNYLGNPTLLKFTIKAEAGESTPSAYKSFPIPHTRQSNGDKVISVDFDNDEDIDLLSQGLWLENDGNENFTEHTLAMPYTFELKAVDFDHDNDFDIVLGTFSGLALMLNDGNMNFTTEYIPDTYIVTSISVADQNGDGLEDILFADQYSGVFSLAWLVNNGDGTFNKLLMNGVDLSYIACAANIDNDNLIDVVAIGKNFIFWYKNTGTGYTKQVLYEDVNANSFYGRLDVEDTDSDGDQDILASGSGAIHLLVNNGMGSFTNMVPIQDTSTSFYELLGVADMDGDADLDIISATGYSAICFINEGTHTFTRFDISNFSEAVRVASIVDMEGDGDLDLAYILSHGNIGWTKNTTYSEAVPFNRVVLTDVLPQYTTSASWADYDKDGDQDILVTGSEGSTHLTRIYRRHNDVLEIAKELPGLINAQAIWFDFDNDGDTDILQNGATNASDPWDTAEIKIYINTNGDFEEYTHPPLKGSYMAQVKTADLNNDGKDELIIGGGNAGIYTLKDGLFHNVYSIDNFVQNGRLAIADIDLDGDLDIAATGWLGNDELGVLGSIFVNEGNLSFKEQTKIFNGTVSGSLLLSDFDNDADPDLASIGSHRNSSWGGNYASSSFYNNIDAAFEIIIQPEDSRIYVGYNGAANVGDFNNDGYNDVITQHGDGWHQLGLFLNNTTGWFSEFTHGIPGVSPDDNFIEIVDFDLDNDLDFSVGDKLIRNNTDVTNTSPIAPDVLVDSVRNNTLYMHWSGAADVETSILGLTYQPYVGNTAGSQNIMSALSDIETGKRYVHRAGIAQKKWKIQIPEGGDYHWGVQAIDPGLLSSAFTKKTVHVIHVNGERNSCKNTLQIYKATPAGTYTWQVEGGEVIRMSGDEIGIEWKADTGIVRVSDGMNQNTIDVHVVDRPTPMITGLVNACASSSAGFYSTVQVQEHSYRWELIGGDLLYPGDTSTVSVRWGAPGLATIKVFESSRENACTIEAELAVTIRSLTSPVINGPSQVCVPGASTAYTVSPANGSTVSWKVFGGQIIGSSTSAEVIVAWNEQAIGRISVNESNPEFCLGTDILEVDLIPVPTANIIGASTICNDTEGLMYTTEIFKDAHYEWSVQGGTMQSAANLSSVKVNWNKAGAGKIRVTQRLSSCESSDSLLITFYPAIAKPHITNSGDVLSGPEAFQYQWFYEDESIEGAVSQTHAPNDPGIYQVQITDEKGCTVLSYDYPYLVTAIDDDMATSVSAYPNPFQNHFFLKLLNDYRGPIEIMLMDATGRVVLVKTLWKQDHELLETIFSEKIKCGFLILTVRAGDVTIHKKLLAEM